MAGQTGRESDVNMWESEKKDVVKAAQRMASKGLVAGTSGNVSVRTNDSQGKSLLAITPSSRAYESMTVDDIIVVDHEGKRVEGELAPSVETMLHVGIYRSRSKVNAIIHTHAVFSSVIAVAGTEIPPILDDQIVCIGGEIKIASYALPGSPELAANVIEALGPRNAVVLANHGALVVGRDMGEALTMCDLLEKTAQIYLYALSVNRVNSIPPEMAQIEKTFFSAIYG